MENNPLLTPEHDGATMSPLAQLCRYADSIGMYDPTPENVQSALKQAGATFPVVTLGNLALARALIQNFVEGPVPPDDEADPFLDE